jgi:tetratricopeptide (TPR) repeat protein
MTRSRLVLLVAPAVFLVGCASNSPQKGTLASLRHVAPDTAEMQVNDGIVKATQSYRRFLDETPESSLTPDAMRRLADLEIEKEFGILGDGKPISMPAPSATAKIDDRTKRRARRETLDVEQAVSERDLEQRVRGQQLSSAAETSTLTLPDGTAADPEQAGSEEAIKLYDELLTKYPSYSFRDQVLYQKARACDELGRTAESMKVMEQLIAEHPRSRYLDEVQFRRAEHFFTRKKYHDAESAYSAVVDIGQGSEYYELALYKLGWTLYKQEFYEEALHRYFALLDYKVSTGYDFDATHEEEEERRIEDTFQVVSLSLSNLGGPEVIGEYFTTNGNRGYEDRVYRYFAEFYLTKRRYNDAATVYRSFVALYPNHVVSPRFSMRVIDIYETGGFPKLVLDSKKEFATRYGLHSEYWTHFDVAQSPEVMSFLKSNLTDLANHYHAQYQDEKKADEKGANYAEAAHWYREFLASFHDAPEAPAINYQLADLLRENKDYAGAAQEYERTAYDYPSHEKASAAGYAAIYAHREHLKVVSDEEKEQAKRATVDSSLKFADTFPTHEHAAVVLSAAAEDLYDMKDYLLARASAQKLIDNFPNAEPSVRRTAWTVVAHSSFDLAEYPAAEQAYTQVLAVTAQDDESRGALTENLAAAIYKQGEQANELGDYRAAADHYLRIKQVAPTAKIRAGAEYDAGAALIHLQDWTAAAQVLDDFRRAHPEHELEKEATKQIAIVRREAGELAQAAAEYERVASESEKPELRAEALLLAGELHEQAKNTDRALDVYSRYVEQFPSPVETAVETRSKIAEIYKARHDDDSYRGALEGIVRADKEAGAERTDRTRNLAARGALVLAEPRFERFAALRLVQPFERSLQDKRQAMDATLQTFSNLVAYEVGDVTAAATFYMAEIYSNFSQSLIESDRPTGLAEKAAQDYEIALEDEAFPFEEKAIEVHEKNVELMTGGIYNEWVEKSLARLAKLSPARYAKTEISSGFLDAVDRYTYRVPEKPVVAVDAGATPPPTEESAPAAAPPSDAVPEETPAPSVGETEAPSEVELGVANANAP